MRTRRKFSFCVSRRQPEWAQSTSVRVVSLKRDPTKLGPECKVLDQTLCRIRCYPRDVRIAKLIAQQITLQLNHHKLHLNQLADIDIRTPEELQRMYELYLVRTEREEA